MPPIETPNAVEAHAMAVPAAMARVPPANAAPVAHAAEPARGMIAKHTMPITGVMYISSAGRIEMKAMDTPASVPRSAARGVILRTIGAMKPPSISTKLCTNTHTSPASQPLIGSPVLRLIGMMTNTPRTCAAR